MRRFVLCLGVVMSVMGLSACGGGDTATASSGGSGGSGGAPLTSSSISLPTSVQVVTSN
jgi:hypothetical protein